MSVVSSGARLSGAVKKGVALPLPRPFRVRHLLKERTYESRRFPLDDLNAARPDARRRSAGRRSEEHTSELQSRVDLVCRLLLEKKKKNNKKYKNKTKKKIDKRII